MTKFTGKYLCQSLFFNKVAGLALFSCQFCEISKNTFFIEHLWPTASGSFKYPEQLFHDILLLYSLYTFFYQSRPKRSREKSHSRISRFLSRFFNMKNSTLSNSLVKRNLHNHHTAAFNVESFLLEVISETQVPQNTNIFCLCFRRRYTKAGLKVAVQKQCRSSHQRCSVKKGVLRNFAKFTRRHLCQISFLIKFSCEFCEI